MGSRRGWFRRILVPPLAVACAAAGCGISAALAGEAVAELQLRQAWSVESPERLDLSGLAVSGGKLYAVSDKVDDAIFRLELEGALARAVRAISFTVPEPRPWLGGLDWEAIAVEPGGDFLLASEGGYAAAVVPRSGGTARWITPNLRPAGAEIGLFALPNAGVEGFAVLGPGHFLFLAERQPRGFMEVQMAGDAPSLVAGLCNESRFPVPAGREPDWTDLFVWRGHFLALARNQALVVELIRSPTGAWIEDRAWSFAQTETEASYRYADMTFGMAEGLAISDQTIYVMLDNNGVARADADDDRRSWLFGFVNPLAVELEP